MTPSWAAHADGAIRALRRPPSRIDRGIERASPRLHRLHRLHRLRRLRRPCASIPDPAAVFQPA
ncbi:hypothetical protein BOC40_18865 [Burkholderia pseudomallei]|nr:hypothetical protein BOC39_25715 [Burkholderia pseudomallei]ARK82193.1 hypothetical protein BOC40_18865 [Burkholderia pseudomallei]ARL38382.1 hypothetical protein BOC49_21010 [Burkholderia pseudomallei]ARL47842.1 hypothetical protein BOC50_34285 [Burkholderia pseudomallei]